MRNLNEILNEGIFSDNTSGDIDDVFVNDFVKFVAHKCNIDKHTKTITIDIHGDTMYIGDHEDDNEVFHGFPTKKWKIVNKSGKEFTIINAHSQMDNFINIPDSIKEISFQGSWYKRKYNQNELDNILTACNDAKRLQTLTISCHLPKTDLSKLSLKLQRLNVYVADSNNIKSSVSFNPNQKVSVLEIGYNIGSLENLPAGLKQITARCSGDDLIGIMHNVDTGNNDISKIVFKGRHISQQDIETIRRDAGGQDATEEKKHFDKNAKLISTLKINDTDPTKDATGRPLKYGDVVYVTNNSNYPFDIYISAAGSMIKCLNTQSKPKFIVKMDIE